MSQLGNPQPGKPEPPEQTLVLLLTLADTTWRMLVPTGLLAGLGLYGDSHLGTGPWLTLASLPVGLGVSVVLIKRQLRRVG